MIRINLLPVRVSQKQEKLRGQMIIAGGSLLLVLLACGAVYATLLMNISAEKESIAKKEAEIQRLKKVLGEVTHFKTLQDELRGKLDVLDQLKKGKTGPVHLIDDLSAKIPNKVWLTSFKESKGSINMTGVGLNEESVVRFLQELEKSSYYQNVELGVVEQTMQDDLKLHKFSLSCKAEVSAK